MLCNGGGGCGGRAVALAVVTVVAAMAFASAGMCGRWWLVVGWFASGRVGEWVGGLLAVVVITHICGRRGWRYFLGRDRTQRAIQPRYGVCPDGVDHPQQTALTLTWHLCNAHEDSAHEHARE